MKVKVKKLNENAVVPVYAKEGDAGLDLTATSVTHNVDEDYIQYGTGLAFEIPEGHVGLLFPRSSVTKKDLMLKNSVGVVDSGYRGEVCFRFMDTYSQNEENNIYSIGDRIGQIIIMPYPKVELEEVDELDDTSRGGEGFGSTGS